MPDVSFTSLSIITAVAFGSRLALGFAPRVRIPGVVVEIVLVFGGALAFAWWQLRDLDRERRRREERKQDAGDEERARDRG